MVNKCLSLDSSLYRLQKRKGYLTRDDFVNYYSCDDEKALFLIRDLIDKGLLIKELRGVQIVFRLINKGGLEIEY